MDHSRHYAQLYVAMPEWIDDHLTPFDWYCEYAVRGADKNNFPGKYVESLRGILCVDDQDRMRREEHFRVLTSHG